MLAARHHQLPRPEAEVRRRVLYVMRSERVQCSAWPLGVEIAFPSSIGTRCQSLPHPHTQGNTAIARLAAALCATFCGTFPDASKIPGRDRVGRRTTTDALLGAGLS